MSNINIRKKYIFIHIPKTAGLAMESVAWNDSNVYFYRGHYTIKDFHNYGINIDQYFKWCFVRNPWSRLLSAYDYSDLIKQQFPTFESLVKAIYANKENYSRLNVIWIQDNNGIKNLLPNTPTIFFYNQTSLITKDDKICMDFIGRFENIKEDWENLLIKIQELKINIKESDKILPIRNERRTESFYKQKPYTEYYNNDMISMVEEVYQHDISNFNYKFGL
jgi:hypothetical protein